MRQKVGSRILSIQRMDNPEGFELGDLVPRIYVHHIIMSEK